MKKQILTKENIQRELLKTLNKRRNFAICLTVYLFVSIIFYAAYVVAYLNGADLHNDRLSFSVPYIALPICAFIILFFVIFIVAYYYLDLYRIKTGKIEITEEKLCQKAIENVSYYHRSEKENILYFRHGKVKVNKTVYSYSNIGDYFYIVFCGKTKKPVCVYHTKYNEIEQSQE